MRKMYSGPVVVFLVSCLACGGSGEPPPTASLVLDGRNSSADVFVQHNASAERATVSWPTSTAAAPLDEEVFEDPSILGCKWPSSFLERFHFCLSSAQLPARSDAELIKYGIMDKAMVDALIETCRGKESCNPKRVDPAPFILFWQHNTEAMKQFRSCLQRNTEGLVQLCGRDSKVGTAVSGAAGLHLNLLNVLVTLHSQLSWSNGTRECWAAGALMAHASLAHYLKTKAYKQNKISCYPVLREKCSEECRDFASTLGCMRRNCPFDDSFLGQFMIWQWYFDSEKNVKEHCNLPADTSCSDQTSLVTPTSPDTTHDYLLSKTLEKFKEKVTELSEELKKEFKLPLHVLIAMAVAIGAGIIAILTLLCMWCNGTLCRRNKSLRYRKLPDDLREPEEVRALTKEYHDEME